jgi:hypothetical protein
MLSPHTRIGIHFGLLVVFQKPSRSSCTFAFTFTFTCTFTFTFTFTFRPPRRNPVLNSRPTLPIPAHSPLCPHVCTAPSASIRVDRSVLGKSEDVAPKPGEDRRPPDSGKVGVGPFRITHTCTLSCAHLHAHTPASTHAHARTRTRTHMHTSTHQQTSKHTILHKHTQAHVRTQLSH